MAKGKTSSNTKYTSKGTVGTDKSISRAVRADHLQGGNRDIAQLSAWKKGKCVMLTIPNPDKKATNRRYIRVNARDVWGDPNPKRKTGRSQVEAT